MKKIEIKIILIGLILLSSCGKSNKDDSGSYVSNVNSEDISHLNTTIDSEDAISIDQHCQFMVDFLHACGYSEEDYIRMLFGIPLYFTEN